jgi:glucosamine--fructose-6-phosphate aminotransferase (isomerizing)
MVAIQSYTGTLLVFHLLMGEVAGAGMEYRDAAEQTLASFTRLVGEAEEASLEWVEFLDPIVPTHLLARGPSRASALEGSLLFNETARAPAVAFTAGSFRHGPVEVVEDGFRSIIFAPAGRTRDLNLALARNLIRFGGAVRVVGPPAEDPDLGGDLFWPVAELPEMLAPLVEVVPLQFAALRLAQKKGLDVGRFRHTGLITRDESSFSTE